MTNQSKTGTNRPVWEAEAVYPGLCDQLKKGFSEIYDPELGLNIIQLGLIRNVKINEESAVVKMILTTPFCPYGPSMLESARQKAETVLGREVTIDFDLEPWDFSMMEEGIDLNWGIY
jgi:metal-sulfur cluster biosynthetic enzyme